MEMRSRITEVTVFPKGESIYSEMVTRVKISDEAGGEFVTLEQGESEVKIEAEEWPLLKEEINAAFGRIELWENEQEGTDDE